MALEFGRLQALITADDRQYRRKMADADQLGKKTAGSIRSTFSNLKLAIPSIGGGALRGGQGLFGSVVGGNLVSGAITSAISGVSGALKEGLNSGIEFNKMLETAGVRFSRFFGSAKQTEQFTATIKDFARESAVFDLPSALTGSQRLLQMKFAAKDIPRMLGAIGDAVGGVGGGAEDIDGVTRALGQMVSKGKITAEEMEQLAERGIPGWELLSKAIGRTEAETRKFVEQGRIDARRGVEGIVAMMGEDFAGQSSKAAKTLAGQETIFASTLQEQLGQATQGSFEELKKGYEKATIGLSTTGAQVFATEINKLLTEQTKAVQPYLDKLASGEYFKSAAQTTATTGRVLSQADSAAGAFLSGDLKSFTEQADKLLLEGLGSLAGPLKHAGSDMWKSVQEGFFDGVEGGKSALTQKLTDWGQLGIDALRKIWEWKSPSGVTIRLGQDIVEGFNQGLEAGKRKSAKAIIDAEQMRVALLAELKKLRDDPRIKAMLETISFAEGANYNTLFGGGRFEDYGQHPNQRVTAKLGGQNITSTAAGAYQILKRIDDTLSKRLGLSDFSPETQDLKAIALIKEAGAATAILSGNIEEGIRKLKGIWASLPDSPFGQPTKKLEDLTEQYNASLERLTGQTVKATEAMGRVSAAPLERIKPVELPKAAMPVGFVESVLSVSAKMPAAEASARSLGIAIDETAKASSAATSQVGKFADAIDANRKSWAQMVREMEEDAAQRLSPKARFDRFQDFKQRVGDGFNDIIDSIGQGGDRMKDALRGTLNDVFRSIQSEIILQATGGKFDSIGGFIGGKIGELFKGVFNKAPMGVTTPGINPNAPNPLKTIADKITGAGKATVDAVKAGTDKIAGVGQDSLGKLSQMASCGCPDEVTQTGGKPFLNQLIQGAISVAGSVVGMGGGGGSGAESGSGFSGAPSGGYYTGRHGVKMRMRARGGSALRGMPYLVGEEGAELFIPNASGSILPASETQKAMQAPANIVINFAIHAPQGTVNPQTQRQIATQAAMALQAAIARNG